MSTRRLHLPGGGSFDLALPDSGGKFVEHAPAVLASSGTAWPTVLPVLAGALLGGALTWLLLRFSK